LPAITARRAFGGMVDRFGAVSPARYHGSDAHETGLRDVETDDAAAFISSLDGGFAWCYFFAWEDDWGSPSSRRIFLESEEPPEARERLYAFMEGCWKRNLYLKGKQRVAAKSIAAIPAESIPFIGVAVLIADTGYELYAACETVSDLDQLYSDLGMADETPTDVIHSVCAPRLPDTGEVWDRFVEKSGEWLDLARAAT